MKVVFDADREGNVSNPRVDSSSGHDVIDQAVKEAVKNWKLAPSETGWNGISQTFTFARQGSDLERQASERRQQQERERQARDREQQLRQLAEQQERERQAREAQQQERERQAREQREREQRQTPTPLPTIEPTPLPPVEEPTPLPPIEESTPPPAPPE